MLKKNLTKRRNQNTDALTDACLACHDDLSMAKSIIYLGTDRIAICPTCNSWNYLPRPGLSGQVQIHNTPDYFEHEYFETRRRVSNHLQKRCKSVFKRLNPFISPAQLENVCVLDIGCDTGSFIRCAAEEFHIIPHGVDVSERAIRVASNNGVYTYCGRLEDASTEMCNYSLITAIDVLEHVENPESLLTEIYKRLIPGGFVYIETPNPDSIIYLLGKAVSRLQLSIIKGPLHRLFPPQHLICFSQDAIQNISRKCGFKIMEYNTRSLSYQDLSMTPVLAMSIVLCQIADIVTRKKILHWIILERPKTISQR